MMIQVDISELELIEFKNNIASRTLVDSVEEKFEITQLSFFTIIFSFFTTPSGKQLLMSKLLIDHQPLQVYFFPLAAVLEIGEVSIALYKLGRADNKNLEKTLEFSNKIIKASFIITAVILGTIAQVAGIVVLGMLVPYLFIIGIALNTLYNISSAIYHIVKLYKAPKGSELRAAHQQALVNNIIHSVAGAVLVGVIVGIMVAGVSSGVGLAMIAGVGIITLLSVFIISRVMKYYAQKAAKKSDKRELKNSHEKKLITVQSQKQATISKVFNENADLQAVEAATRAAGDQNDRLYVRDLSHLLNAAKRKGPNTLRIAFINVIDAKIAKLRNQIIQSNKRLNSKSDAKKIQIKHRFFKAIVPNEDSKRQAKISGLIELKQKISTFKGEYFVTKEINDIIKKHKKIFQSFLHDKSDVELIFDAAREYFAPISIYERYNLIVSY